MGLRDYRWVSESLPGKEAPMDVDCVVEKGGRFLVLEFKPEGMPLPMGQRLTLKAMVRTGYFDVWVVWEGTDGRTCQVGVMDRNGSVNFIAKLRIEQLGHKVEEWHLAASREESR